MSPPCLLYFSWLLMPDCCSLWSGPFKKWDGLGQPVHQSVPFHTFLPSWESDLCTSAAHISPPLIFLAKLGRALHHFPSFAEYASPKHHFITLYSHSASFRTILTFFRNTITILPLLFQFCCVQLKQVNIWSKNNIWLFGHILRPCFGQQNIFDKPNIFLRYYQIKVC